MWRKNAKTPTLLRHLSSPLAHIHHQSVIPKLALFCLLALGIAGVTQATESVPPAIAATVHIKTTTHNKEKKQLAKHLKKHVTNSKHAKSHSKHIKRHAKQTKQTKHAKSHSKQTKRAVRALHLHSQITALTLSSNVAPNPDFLSSCPATDQSYFCLGQEIEAIDNARAQEGLGPMSIRLAAFRSLSTSKQLFVLADLERTARGLPPVVALTAQLDDVASQGADQTADPALAGWTLAGGKQAIAWNSNWAGGLSSLAANYYWMYSDGTGFNIDCTQTNTSGCWAHRKNILTPIAGNCGTPSAAPQFVMGAATTSTVKYGPSDAEILVQECGGLPSDAVFTWSQAEQTLGISGS